MDMSNFQIHLHNFGLASTLINSDLRNTIQLHPQNSCSINSAIDFIKTLSLLTNTSVLAFPSLIKIEYNLNNTVMFYTKTNLDTQS